MPFSNELIRMRRYLRDPSANIWTDGFIRRTYNRIQKHLQHRTSVLEDISAQRVPSLYHFSYLFEWEFQYLPTHLSNFYQAFTLTEVYVVTHVWEIQLVSESGSDVSDYGIHFSQPWEAFMGQVPGERIRFRFPRNMRSLKYIAYDEEPIFATTEKRVQHRDSSYLTTEGRPFAYYETDNLDAGFVLYPRPSNAFVDEIDGEGIALHIEGDTEDTSEGSIAVRTTSIPSAQGVAVDIVDTIDNLTMIYDVDPQDIDNLASESDFPAYLQKYVRYGTVAWSYTANTDGRIPSLGEYWQMRYEVGIRMVRKCVSNRRNDRDHRLMTKGIPARRSRRHPRLPSAYPATNP